MGELPGRYRVKSAQRESLAAQGVDLTGGLVLEVTLPKRRAGRRSATCGLTDW